MNSEHPILGRPYGIHEGVPESEYHAPALGVVSKSALDAVDRSPAHYLTWLHEPKSDTPAFAFGRAFHCAVLEPERYARDYITMPDFGDMRSSKNRDKRDTWLEGKPGVVLPAEDAARIGSMVAALRAHRLASKLFVGGLPEVTVTWQDEGTGLSCKTRMDYYVPQRELTIDLKSTKDASLDAFRKDVANYRYHVQDALYRDSARAAGEPIKHFVFVAVEKEAPYGIGVYTLDQDAIQRGYNAARANIDQLAEAVRTDAWRCYPERIESIDLPPWAA